MGTKQVVGASLLVIALFATSIAFGDEITGSVTNAAFQNWTVRDLKDNGKPYWDNKSIVGKKQKKKTNVGFSLVGAPTAETLTDGPDNPLPYWGKSGKSKKKTGGNADLNFFFQRTEPTNAASLQLEIGPNADINEFGWYNLANPSQLHPIFLGTESPITNDTFSPSLQYGLYLKRDDQVTFYTQSSLNPAKDTSHQHFVVFQESAKPGAEVYWIGIEDQTVRELKGKEGGLGAYNNMLIRIGHELPSPVPEPSTVNLVFGNLLMLLVAGLITRRR